MDEQAREKRRVLRVGIREREEKKSINKKLFSEQFKVKAMAWNARNVGWFFNQIATAEADRYGLHEIFGRLGMGDNSRYAAPVGFFDHGDVWGQYGRPVMLVGHPYGVRGLSEIFEELSSRFPTIGFKINDRPSYYSLPVDRTPTDHVRLFISNVNNVPMKRRGKAKFGHKD